MAKQKTEQVNWRTFERDNKDVKAADVLKVPLSRIQVATGFNPRDLTKPETQDKIRAIADSYKAGRFVDPIKVRMTDSLDHLLIVDGECRYRAALIADKELKQGGSPGIAALTVVPFKGNDVDQLVHAVTANEGERLTTLELADVVKRFINLNYSRPDIAKLLGKSLSWVDQLFFMSGMDKAVKDMVVAGAVAPDVAMEVAKKSGSKAPAKLKEMVKQAGGKKVTAKHLKAEKDADKEQRRQAKQQANDKLIDAAAARKGMTREAYLESVIVMDNGPTNPQPERKTGMPAAMAAPYGTGNTEPEPFVATEANKHDAAFAQKIHGNPMADMKPATFPEAAWPFPQAGAPEDRLAKVKRGDLTAEQRQWIATIIEEMPKDMRYVDDKQVTARTYTLSNAMCNALANLRASVYPKSESAAQKAA